MKYWMLATLLLPLTALSSKSEMVTCTVKDFKVCADCAQRVPVSCENHSYIGSLEIKTKPAKIHWTVSNPKAGTERVIVADNSKLTLKELKSAKNWNPIAQNLKVKVGAGEQVALLAIEVPAQTSLFKNQKGKEIAAAMKPVRETRSIASAPEPMAGGVKRAQNMIQNKK